MEYIKIFDTTLRDGEQSPGAAMSIDDKIRFAVQLEKLGVDVIEAGFPAKDNKEEQEAVRKIAEAVEGSVICGLARCNKNDIESAVKAIGPALDRGNGRVHIFVGTSDTHTKNKLRWTIDKVVSKTIESIGFAISLGVEDIEFSPEDATRTKRDVLYEVLSAAIEAGATTINIPDTVGYAMPSEYGFIISDVKKNVKGANKVVISVHNHNDLGNAIDTSWAGVVAGARQVEGTILGIGERAGNCALEPFIMRTAIRPDYYKGFKTGINHKEIYNTTKMLSKITGIPIPRNYYICGRNVLSHGSGIHQDGVLKDKRTYEIFSPEMIGAPKDAISGIVLTKHSGRKGFEDKVSKLGVAIPEEKMEDAFEIFKRLAAKKKEVFVEDLEIIADEVAGTNGKAYHLLEFFQQSGSFVDPSASVKIYHKSTGKEIKGTARGNGPVSAIFNAIDKATKKKFKLLDYKVDSLTEDRQAQAVTTVCLGRNGASKYGRGIAVDTNESAALAYIDAVNKF